MRKRYLVAFMIIALLSGCGVSQAEYDKVVAERDALQKQINEQAEILSSIEDRLNMIENSTAQKPTSQSTQGTDHNANEATTDENSSVSSSDAVSSDNIQVIKEYTLPDSIGWYTRHFLIVQNNASATVDISTSSLAYDADGNLIGTADANENAIGAGCTSILIEAIETDRSIDHYETTISVSKSRYDSVIQDISYVITDVDRGIIAQVTNNGGVDADFALGTCLFLRNGEIVGYEQCFFTNDNNKILSGETISKQLTTYEKFDSYEFYMTARGEHHW